MKFYEISSWNFIFKFHGTGSEISEGARWDFTFPPNHGLVARLLGALARRRGLPRPTEARSAACLDCLFRFTRDAWFEIELLAVESNYYVEEKSKKTKSGLDRTARKFSGLWHVGAHMSQPGWHFLHPVALGEEKMSGGNVIWNELQVPPPAPSTRLKEGVTGHKGGHTGGGTWGGGTRGDLILWENPFVANFLVEKGGGRSPKKTRALMSWTQGGGHGGGGRGVDTPPKKCYIWKSKRTFFRGEKGEISWNVMKFHECSLWNFIITLPKPHQSKETEEIRHKKIPLWSFFWWMHPWANWAQSQPMCKIPKSNAKIPFANFFLRKFGSKKILPKNIGFYPKKVNWRKGA